ncbi:MAG: sodium:calcium antiporter [Cetobacterium sp.]|uniref:sodium:calcium antiporter n=1 Tax=Cetobacterium sp. TaxID=2071632 RepID=UPI003F3A38AA
MSIFSSFLILVVSCAVINKFSDMLGDNIGKLALKLNIAPNVRGVLLDGVSSSMPEFITSAAAAILLVFSNDVSAFSDVGVGTIGGSAIFNILIIPFLSILFVSSKELKNIEINKKALLRDLGVYLVSVAILFFASKTGVLTSKIGILMTGLYIVYAIYLVKTGKKEEILDKIEDETSSVEESIKVLWLKTIASLIPIGYAIHWCIIGASNIGTHFGVSRLIMSLVILAGVTSIPDALLSIKSAKNGELDASIANAVGSNSFDILICLGFIIAVAGVNIKINFSEVSYIFTFLILSSICYSLAFLFKSSKTTKLILLGSPYIGFVYYLYSNV